MEIENITPWLKITKQANGLLYWDATAWKKMQHTVCCEQNIPSYTHMLLGTILCPIWNEQNIAIERIQLFMQYAQRLRDLREDRDLTQEAVAKIIGTSQSYYAQYESGKRELPFTRAIEIARFYNISLDYLAGFTDTLKPIN